MTNINDLTPGTWNVDPVHSTVGFVARHLMIAKVRGRFSSFSGTITVPEDRLATKLQASVELSSISTGDEQRDSHLRTADFFDIENHPAMTFESKSVKADGDDYVLTGDLTIKGITRSVDFDLEFEGVGPDPWGGTRAGFNATTEINRTEFGIEWNAKLETGGWLVGDKIKIELEIEAVKQ
jgi:polyisoprenoid-binding protein YceI